MNEIDLHYIKKIINEELERSNTPGLSFALINNKEIVYAESFGIADIENQRKLDTKTPLMWASISKFFTITAIMQQYEKNRFKLDDPIINYLPEGSIKQKKGFPPITFRHLMTHTAGIGEIRRGIDIFKRGFGVITYDDDPIPSMESFHSQTLHPSAPAGQKFAYSNIGASILGYLVTIFSGLDFREYIMKNIFDPLEMHKSDFIRSDRVTNLALGYKWDKKKKELKKAKIWNNIIKPSGGLNSTLEDMCKFVIMLLNKGKYKSVQILKPETFDLMWSPQYRAHDSFKNYFEMGLIFRMYYSDSGIKIIGHTGGISGFTSTINIIPELNIGMLTNSNLGEGLHNRITLRIRNRILKYLTKSKNEFSPEKHPNKKYWDKIKGYYGGYPGFLSNTRIIADGIDYRVYEKNDNLYLSGFIGQKRKPLKLYGTKDPLVFEFPQNEADDIQYVGKIGFKYDVKADKIVEMGWHFFRYRKIKFYQTFRWKVYLMLMIIIIIIVFSSFF